MKPGPELLEQVRLLTNLETSKRKLLQIILIGQPELRDLLDRPEMRQIAQRITGRYHLEPLSRSDSRIYVRHRLRVAGAHSEIFSESAINELHKLSRGIPRLINVLADRALLAAYTRDERKIGSRLVGKAAAEVFGRARSEKRRFWFGATATALGAVAIAAGLLLRHVALNPAEATREDTVSTTSGLPALALEATAAPARRNAETAESDQASGLDELLASRDAAGDTAAVEAALFELWGATYVADAESACDQAAQQGLQCLSLPDPSLADLRQTNRPAIVQLDDADGRRHSALLLGLNFETARLQIGNETREVSIAELSRHWFGSHWLLWQPATEITGILQPGMRSERIAWLRSALAAYAGTEVPAVDDPQMFDEALADALRAYQQLRHLDVDGLLGAATQITLQAELGHRTGPTIVEVQ